jgi:hypothetical protein
MYVLRIEHIKFNGLFMCFEHGAYKSFQRVELCKSRISIFSAVNIGAFLSILQYFAINYLKKGRKVNLQKKERSIKKWDQIHSDGAF